MTDLNPEGIEKAATAMFVEDAKGGRMTTQRLARAAVTAYLGHTEVTTVEELDALPVGTVVRSAAGTIACHYGNGLGVVFGDERPFSWDRIALPATVLHRPAP